MNDTDYDEALKDYFALMDERPDLFRGADNEQSGYPRIVKDYARICQYTQKTGTLIGIAYASKYNMMVVDLTEEKDGFLHPYERVVPSSTGTAVVVAPRLDGKLVFIKQWRHAIQDEQIAFIRGFGEDGIPAEYNAAKEVSEEIGANVCSNMLYLGTVTTDSGLTSGEAEAYTCQVDSADIEDGYEGIEGLVLLTDDEAEEYVRTGEITDGFTLAVLELLRYKKA